MLQDDNEWAEIMAELPTYRLVKGSFKSIVAKKHKEIMHPGLNRLFVYSSIHLYQSNFYFLVSTLVVMYHFYLIISMVYAEKWWLNNGFSTPKLQRLAIRIL